MPSAKKKTLRTGEVVWYAKHKGADGRWHEEGPPCRTKREAEKVASQRELDAERGVGVLAVNAKITFEDFVEQVYWPTTHNLSLTTQAAYRSYLDAHFIPAFGALPLRQLSAPVVQNWVNRATRELTASSVVKYHSFLKTICERALRDGRMASNPCAYTALPRPVKKERTALTPADITRWFGQIPDQHLALVNTKLDSGCRWGEIAALRPCDIDWANDELLITRAYAEVPKKISPTGERMVIKAGPKEGEWRRVKLAPASMAMIRGHMLARGLRDTDLLFGTSRGTPMSRNTFRTRAWDPAKTAAGLPDDVTLHSLRHAHISWLLAGGADLAVVMRRVGHRQLATTQGYLHTFPDAGDRALAAIATFKSVQEARLIEAERRAGGLSESA